MREFYKIVSFEKFCPLCEYEKLEDHKDPCNECLENPVNYETHQPVNFKLKEKLRK